LYSCILVFPPKNIINNNKNNKSNDTKKVFLTPRPALHHRAGGVGTIRMVVQPATAKKMPFFLQILVFFIIFASGKGR
jgi:hypothetical protein